MAKHLGVAYVYEQEIEERTDPKKSTENNALGPEYLLILSVEIINAFEDALNRVNMDMIADSIKLVFIINNLKTGVIK